MFVQFWGAAREVTGSCFLVEAGRSRVLVDCGLVQGSEEDEARNRDPLPFDLGRIDAVVLTHAHLDHSGRLPLLSKTGYRGPIYTQRATRDLCRIMLADAGHVNEKETESINRKRRRQGRQPLDPLYTAREGKAAMRRFRALDYGERRALTSTIDIRLTDAGHILGSSIVELWAREGECERKVVFSGDLGHYGAPILRDPQPVETADLVVMESTYGDRRHRSWQATWEELAGVIADASHRGGNILIPAFAVGRTQELLYAFARNYTEWGLDRWTVFLDSPMAIEATEVYRRHGDLFDHEAAVVADGNDPFAPPNLHLTRTTRQSMGINSIRSGAIIIAGSGMCTGGRIKHHLKHNLWRQGSHLIFVGYQAAGTLGRALVEGAREVSLWGEPVRVAADVHTIGGFSAHADQAGLARWYGQVTGRPAVALVHGEPTAMDTFATKLETDYGTTVHRPDHGGSIDLRTLTPIGGGVATTSA